jgi:hypothetical protein
MLLLFLLLAAVSCLLIAIFAAVVMLVWGRFRRPASFFALLPAAAVGGAVFGFWLALQHYGPITSDQDLANAVYYGAIPSSVVGAGLALRALTWRSGRLWPVRSAVIGSVTALITLTCLILWRTASDAISTGPHVGWDPISLFHLVTASQMLVTLAFAFVCAYACSALYFRAIAQ